MDRTVMRVLGVLAIILVGIMVVTIFSNILQGNGIAFLTRGAISPDSTSGGGNTIASVSNPQGGISRTSTTCGTQECPSLQYEFHTVDIPIRDHDTVAPVTIPLFNSNSGTLKQVIVWLETRGQFNTMIENMGAAPDQETYSFVEYPRATMMVFRPNGTEYIAFNTFSGSAQLRTASVEYSYDGVFDFDGASGEYKEGPEFSQMGDTGPLFLSSATDLALFTGTGSNPTLTVDTFNPADDTTGALGGNGSDGVSGTVRGFATQIGGTLHLAYAYTGAPSALAAPGPIQNLVGSNGLLYQQISWNPVPDATQYAVYVGSGGACSRSNLYAIVESPMYRRAYNNSQAPLTSEFSVRAIGPAGYGPCTGVITSSRSGTAPYRPAEVLSLTATQNLTGRIDLSWVPGGTSTTAVPEYYQIYRSAANTPLGPFLPYQTVPSTQTTFSDTDLGGLTMRYYRVKAVHSIWGESNYSMTIPGRVV